MSEQDSDEMTYRDVEHMAPANDQRQEFRLTVRIRVAIEVEAADGDSDGRELTCNSGDISANGLRVNSAEPLPEGAILPLTIELGPEWYQLIGEVRWCFPATEQGSGYIAGFALYESDQTSILEWKEAIVQLLVD